ncbi:MAG: Fic family protein [Pseudobdellovibrionaceae bacterium]
MVLGTLQKGFDLYKSLPQGLARSLFIMFLVSDVHPFQDGNGRLARIMMNAELVQFGLASIIIPTVYREDYLLTLRALTRRSDPEPYVRMLVKAHEFSAMDFANYVKIKRSLEQKFWFSEPHEAKRLD